MNTRPLTTAILISVVLLTGCTATAEPPQSIEPTASSIPTTVEPLVVGERSTEEGWVGDEELHDDDRAVAADDHRHDPPAPQELAAAVTTGNQVLIGWLTPDQAQRRDTLAGVAAQALIDAFDDPRFTPVAHRQFGPTHVVAADQLQIVTRHRLDTGDVVDLTLIPEPDTPHGWIAIAITGH